MRVILSIAIIVFFPFLLLAQNLGQDCPVGNRQCLLDKAKKLTYDSHPCGRFNTLTLFEKHIGSKLINFDHQVLENAGEMLYMQAQQDSIVKFQSDIQELEESIAECE